MPTTSPRRRRTRHLGPPLVDNFKELIKLSPSYPTWIDPQKKRVVLVGEVCRATMGLEMFACLASSEKDYESVVVVDTKAAIVHAALLQLRATPGKPVQFMPQYRAAWGTEVDIDLIWKDPQGKAQQAPAQQWYARRAHAPAAALSLGLRLAASSGKNPAPAGSSTWARAAT